MYVIALFLSLMRKTRKVVTTRTYFVYFPGIVVFRINGFVLRDGICSWYVYLVKLNSSYSSTGLCALRYICTIVSEISKL